MAEGICTWWPRQKSSTQCYLSAHVKGALITGLGYVNGLLRPHVTLLNVINVIRHVEILGKSSHSCLVAVVLEKESFSSRALQLHSAKSVNHF